MIPELRSHKERPLRVARTAAPLYVAPKLETLDLGNCSASRTPTIVGPINADCAVDHSLCSPHLFVTASTRMFSSTKKKGRVAFTRVGGPNLSCHEKGSSVPTEPGTMSRRYGTGQSQIKPQLGRPFPDEAARVPAAFRSVWTEMMRISPGSPAWLPH